MPTTAIHFYRETYAHLHANLQPYPWQEALFLRLIDNDWPPSVTAPTGAGKTSLITIWLAALAWQAEQGSLTIPRRLVWVVDRRVVVDQATAEAENLRKRIADYPRLQAALAKLCLKENGDEVLGISTLRGELADNREWVKDPSRAAIAVGTVDMIGSRLLFSGYRDSFRVRAHHAGLLGQDSLIVNDEAHLTPAFARLLRDIDKRANGLKPVRVIHLSATLNGDGKRFPDSFQDDITLSETFKSRFCAPKRLHFHQATNNQEARKLCVKLATENAAQRTIVFVTKPEDAAVIAKLLQQIGKDRVVVLTGTQRGDYRDNLANKDLAFRDFQSQTEPAEPCWLVATSAGEVGINISCSRLITLMDTADHLLQRFGRLNRFGETAGEAHLVYTPTDEKDTRKQATLKYLRSLPSVPEFPETRDISVAAVFEHSPTKEEISEKPKLAALHDWIIDRWSLTSLNSTVKPEVEPWLHGKQENLPRTAVVWREDVKWLAQKNVDPDDAAKVFRVHRVLPKEQLEEPTHKLLEKLETIVPQPALLLKASGEVEQIDFWPSREELSYAKLILPPGCGYLDDGMFSPSGDTAQDVPDGEERARFFARWTEEDGWTIRRLGSNVSEPLEGITTSEIRQYLNKKDLLLTYFVECPAEDGNPDEPTQAVIYAKKKPPQKAIQQDVTLKDHQWDVARRATCLADRLGFDKCLVDTYKWVGEHHDLGKAHTIWQAAMNCVSEKPLAKTGKRTRPKQLNGFRHEFASLAEAPDPPNEHRDLAMHLIACHHGWARPHFRDNASAPDDPDSADRRRESMLRFARLHRQYGPWGLAYLEAIFRAADWLASEEVTPVPGEEADEDA